MSPDPAILKELVRRVVDSVHPLRIILFGSAARGEMGPNSDLDALIVVADESDCRAVDKVLARKLRGLGCAIDIVVVRQGIWNSTATTLISSSTRHSRKGRSSTVPPPSPRQGRPASGCNVLKANSCLPVNPCLQADSGKTSAS